MKTEDIAKAIEFYNEEKYTAAIFSLFMLIIETVIDSSKPHHLNKKLIQDILAEIHHLLVFL